ncbi:MAG: helix-turn-helix transcriptional regulator [Pseudomonadota bacterium]
MAHPIDLYVGQKLRQRRRLLGMTQQKLADAVSIRFQQIQKYESGANRISASRLWALSRALDVPVSFFFDGADQNFDNDPNQTVVNGEANGHHTDAPADAFQDKDTIDLVRAYYKLNEEPRRRLLDLAKAISGDS